MISKDFTISNTRFRSGHTDGPFLAVAITDVFSWVWLVRVKQPGRTWASFSLSGMGWERMFNDGEGHVWWKFWFKLEERRESFRPPSLCPSPLSTGVFHGLSCGCRSGKAPGSRGTEEADAWEVVRPLAHPLRLGCEAFPVLAKATPLWPKQNRGGGEARIPVLRRNVSPHYWVRLSSLGHKASLEFGRWSNFRSHWRVPPWFSFLGENYHCLLIRIVHGIK